MVSFQRYALHTVIPDGALPGNPCLVPPTGGFKLCSVLLCKVLYKILNYEYNFAAESNYAS
jgi:hypothetical protein